ncbi:YdiU family protein [Leucobacter weissii]|uniref:Protein nucleotidyltransferase YdiU n=1 Tax=Leucobacter weissii TaxID=1983706 RepID=A0A939SB84_9MICO|nr:YdiU family protein [Leucobacter weissii]MBO1901138.1 YdiU family protein [Leucobacter weissii]
MDVPTVDAIALGDAFARELPELGASWRAVRPEDPELLALNEPLARELGLDPIRLRGERGVRLLLGNELPEGAAPVAQVYAGHQFGAYAPRLGDGRALLLGEIRAPDGRLVDLHLKGSGPTPFARADGFAAVGPMLREYLMGEAMHALGIPTTRALAVVATGRGVRRDDSFDALPGAVLVRTAGSHLRVGTFQYARSTGNLALLRRLSDHAIARHFPDLAERADAHLGLLSAVVEAQARLVASWMLVGFVHGVMNTDNTTISGETIDYGPCAFLDAYDPAAVFSSIDHAGRYAYGSQPGIALWNLTRLAESLLPLLPPPSTAAGASGSAQTADPESAHSESAQAAALDALSGFGPAYDAAWSSGMRAKLGIAAVPVERFPDAALVELSAAMLGELQMHRIDYTRFFRVLADAARGRDDELFALYPDGRRPGAWLSQWTGLSPDARAMEEVNPVVIPRNHLVDAALDAATEGDLSLFEELLDAVTRPYVLQAGRERYALPAPAGSRPHVTYCGT